MLDAGGIVAAVADGAGSAKFAEEGATIAVNIVVAAVSAAIISSTTDFAKLIHDAAIAARDAVIAHAEGRGIEPRQFASTLLALVSTEHGSGALQLGDGVILASEIECELDWVFWPQRGEYANTTRFLTDDDATTRFEVTAFARSLSEVVMISDGLEPLAIHYASKKVHHPFCDGLLAPLQRSKALGLDTDLSAALELFLSSPAVTSRADDDLSIIVATNRLGPESP